MASDPYDEAAAAVVSVREQPADIPGGEHAVAAEREPPASKTELRSWMCIDFANSVYSTVGISGFLPLLLQSSALEAAGFPNACGNVITDLVTLSRVFNSTGSVPDCAHYLPDYVPPPCVDDGPSSFVGGYVRGLPATASQCRLSDGLTEQPLSVGAGTDPTTYATLCIAFATVLQVVVFVCLAATADYGGHRRRMLLASSWAGGLLSILCAGVGPSTWWLGAPLMIFSNCCFGLNSISCSAYLPKLVRALPDILARPAGSTERLDAELKASNELSNKGFAAGYGAGVCGILLSLPLMATLPEIRAYQGTMVLVGLWWLVFMIPPARYLRTRPGPPLPPGKGYVSTSVSQTRETLRAARALPVTGWFLVVWAVGSDAIFSIGTLGGLYANSSVDWGCIPKTTGILLMFLLVPIFAMGGNFGYLAVSKRWNVPERTMLLVSMLLTSLIALWGIAGFVSESFGLRTGGEMLVMGVWYGLHIGAYQALSRALFSTLVPSGNESGMYALYELTNRGSSAVGPFVLSIIQQTTGDLRWGFVFVLINILLPAWGLARLDLQAGAAAAQAHGAATQIAALGDKAGADLGGPQHRLGDVGKERLVDPDLGHGEGIDGASIARDDGGGTQPPAQVGASV